MRLRADSQPKSVGLVWRSAAAWRCPTFVRWSVDSTSAVNYDVDLHTTVVCRCSSCSMETSCNYTCVQTRCCGKMFYLVYSISFSICSLYFISFLYKPSAILCFCSCSRVHYRAAVSAHSSLVVLLVFIDTHIALYYLYILEQINKHQKLNRRYYMKQHFL